MSCLFYLFSNNIVHWPPTMCKALSQGLELTLRRDTVLEGYFLCSYIQSCTSLWISIHSPEVYSERDLPPIHFQGTARDDQTNFGFSKLGEGGATGIQWVEARDLAKQPTKNRTVPTTKTCLAQNINNADAEKPCHQPSTHQKASCCILVISPTHETGATMWPSQAPQRSWATNTSKFQNRYSHVTWPTGLSLFLS